MKTNESTFRYFKTNVRNLTKLRPDLYVTPEEKSYKIKGEVSSNEDFKEIFNDKFETVFAINTSLILNSTGYFEGFLESILLRKIGNVNDLTGPIFNIVNDYQNQIIRLSSLGDFNKNFQKLFGMKIIDAVSDKEKFNFIEDFYFIRHLIAHASTIKSESFKEGFGTRLIHTDKQYQQLMNKLKIRYSFKFDINIDFYMLIVCSNIIDDFCKSIFDVSEQIVENLDRLKLLESCEHWEYL